MDFDDWPMDCPDCGQETVFRVTTCPVCNQRHAFDPASPGNCPTSAPAPEQQPTPTDKPQTDPDDAQDWW
jgi:hypothetical protein